MPIGRANTVLVFGEGDSAVSVITSVVARILPAGNGDRVVFTGPVSFADSAVRHIHEIVLPIIDRILDGLNRPRPRFEISIVNLGAASLRDIGLLVSGFSADVPVFLATLSAALEIPLPESILSTGHVASADGDIRFVKNIPAKARAALSDGTIETFIFPSLHQDGSIESLSPSEKEKVEVAILDARSRLRAIEVSTISRCVRALAQKYGSQGEKAAFEIARTGNEGGLYSVLKAVAAQMAEGYADNEISARVDRFWQEVSNEERLKIADEYMEKFGQLLPSELTENGGVRIKFNLPKVLKQHPRVIRRLRGIGR